jgi:predicted RNase H-like nuclease (RuvC/YqgF family)
MADVKNKSTRTTRQPQRGLTFDDVWAALMETRERQKEFDKRFDEQRAETRKLQEEYDKLQKKFDKQLDKQAEEARKRQEEYDKQMEEARKRQEEFDKQAEVERKRQEGIDRQIKETSRIVGQLGNRLGEVVECLTTPNLHRKFDELGYSFGSMCRNKVFKNEKRQFLAEVDVFLENGIYALAVEVKTNLGADDIKEHIERMKTIRIYADGHNDKRKFMGAVAAPKVDESVRIAAYRAGFFVIEPSEEAVEVIVPEGFKPKMW